MIHSATIENVPVQTGDLLCTTDGAEEGFFGQFWRAVGSLVPGQVDHVVVYVGPGWRCVEAGPHGVITFELPEGRWDGLAMLPVRGFVDTLHGVVSPVETMQHAEDEQRRIRESVAAYCLAQAEAKKPYNFNFLDSASEDTFYCSQLAYHAYRKHGIDLNKGLAVLNGLNTPIIFPAEIWEGGWTCRTVDEYATTSRSLRSRLATLVGRASDDQAD